MITALRLARTKTGKTMRHFAREHGFAETALCRIERGQAYIPEKWRQRLASSLQIGIDELCDERGWPRFIKS